MITPAYSLEQITDMHAVEQDWLFEKLLWKLNRHQHLILAANHGWGIEEYVSELRFHLGEKNPDIHVCYMDMMPARTPDSFLELFAATLYQRFPEVTSRIEKSLRKRDTLRLPTLIAQRKKVRIAVFLANSHQFHRFRDPTSFLRTLKLKLKNQKNCIFCLYGNNNQHFRDLVQYPGPLSGLGQLFELNHNPLNHRSASIRKLFHDHNLNIGYTTSVHMSYIVNNHPFYLKLLAWHALIRTQQTCTLVIVENAMKDLIHHFELHFYKIVECLTPKQLSFLKALIEGNQKLYPKAMRDKYKLGSTSNIARIKLSLEKKELIATGNRNNDFTDPIFREWLRRHYFADR